MGQEVGRRDSVGKSEPRRHPCKEVGMGISRLGFEGPLGGKVKLVK